MSNNQYIVFTENPPLRTKGHGLSVLLYQIISSDRSKFKSLITFQENQELTDSDTQEIGIKVITINFLGINRWFKHYYIRYLFSIFKFLLKLFSLRSYLKSNTASPILVCIGTSSRIVVYAWIMQKFASNPIHVYIVDDIIAVNQMIKNKFDEKISAFFLPRLYIKCEKIYCISEGLKNNLAPALQSKSEILLPVFETIKSKPVASTDFSALKVLFSGGLNVLYNDTIQLFDQFLQQFNEKHNTKHQLIIQTYSSRNKFDALLLSKQCLYKTSYLRSDIEQVLQEADVFLIPYSFDSQKSKIVSTSFPQKIAQLIQYNKPLFFMLPSYSSVGRFCFQNKLDALCTDNTYEAFEKIFSKIVSDNFSIYYSQIYQSYFSPANAIKILNNNL